MDNAEETLLVNNALHSFSLFAESILTMNKFTVPILFMLIKLLSLLNFMGQKERRKAYLNAKDIDTRLSQTILQKDHLQMWFFKRIKMNLIFMVRWQ